MLLAGLRIGFNPLAALTGFHVFALKCMPVFCVSNSKCREHSTFLSAESEVPPMHRALWPAERKTPLQRSAFCSAA